MIPLLLSAGVLAFISWFIYDIKKRRTGLANLFSVSKNAPVDDLEDYYPQAFVDVISELEGPPEIKERMFAGRHEFLQLLGDSRKAGHWVAQTLDGLDWDWPSWCEYVKTSMYANDTLRDLRQQASLMKPADALDMMTVAQLKAALKQHGGLPLPGKHQKADLIAAVKALSITDWAQVANVQIQAWLNKKELVCRQKMGARMASRISHIAIERRRLQQRRDPGLLALRPRWGFICSAPQSAPKSCKKLNGKVLPAQQAMSIFPTLPCERLDCCCRIEAQA